MKWFSIEGAIGAGKSTICNLLRTVLSGQVDVIEEPVQQWIDVGILAKFYEDPSRYSYHFQTYTFLTRMECIMSAESLPSDVKLVERSIFSDRRVFAEALYNEGKITEMEWKMYTQWWDWLSKECCRRIGKPSGYIYLRTTADIAFERMNKRKRTEESEIPYDYIEKNVASHEQWLLEDTEANVLVVDASVDFETHPEEFEKILQQIQTFISQSV